MKILLLTDRMETGGAETHLMQLATDLQEKGHSVLLWCSGGRLARALEQNGIPCILQPPPSRNPISLFWRRRKLIRLIKKEHPDVLHAHTRLTAQLIRRTGKYGCAEIVTVHARFRSGKILSRVSYWGRATITVSEDLRDYAESTYKLPKSQITVIPNGIDCRRFYKQEDAHTSIRILFASRLDADCSLGAELLCRLAPKLCAVFPDLQISIAGGGSEYLRLSNLAQSLNQTMGEERLSLLGRVDDMASLLQKQDIFVGVSRAAMEAAATGCAVILCGNEGYLGILNNQNLADASLTNFCARGEALPTEKLLFQDLCTLINHPTLRREAAANAAFFVRSFFDSRQLCKRTEAVYLSSLPYPKKHRITFGGYFGCDNLGDDAILQGILHELSMHHRTLQPTVLSGKGALDRKRMGVTAHHRKNPFSVGYAILRARLFVLGGGSLLQNRTGNLSLAYYLGLLRLSRALGKKTALYACGIGPLLQKSAENRVCKALIPTNHIGLRDQHSAALLRSIGVREETLSIGADACFLLPMPSESLALYLRKKESLAPHDRLLGIVLRSLENEGELSPILCSITAVCQAEGLKPLFLILDRRYDRSIFERAACELGGVCLYPPDPQSALALFSSCRAVLSMRLHGMLLAARVGTPSLGILTDPCDQKIPAFAKALSLPCLPLSSLSQKAVAEELTALISSSELHRARLHTLADEMQKKAQKDLAKLLQIVYNKR